MDITELMSLQNRNGYLDEHYFLVRNYKRMPQAYFWTGYCFTDRPDLTKVYSKLKSAKQALTVISKTQKPNDALAILSTRNLGKVI